MLQPEDLHPLIGSLRPPSGHRLDLAVGTTFSLKLDALLLPPAAFALFEARLESDDGGTERTPVGLLESVRRHADRIVMFCQAGQIAVPERRRLIPFLEKCVVQIDAPRNGLFHPKVWVLRFQETKTGLVRYRLLNMSRNLTFDRSWDTVVRLDSTDDATGVTLGPGLGEFVRSLPTFSMGTLGENRAQDIESLAAELADVRFALPDGVEHAEFLPIGLGATGSPFPGSCDQLLVMSPYLGAQMIESLPIPTGRSVLISRAEAMDSAADATAGFNQRYVLSPDLVVRTTDDVVRPAEDPAMPEAGLHAKAYLFDVGDSAHLYTGSANATWAGFHHNIEALLHLEGPTVHMGVDRVLAPSPDKNPALIDLLEEYRPSAGTETSPDPLDALRRSVARLQFVATIIQDESRYVMKCRTREPAPPIPDDVNVYIWPLTLRAAGQVPLRASGNLDVEFVLPRVTAITSFLVIEFAHGEERTQTVINAELIGDPADRAGRLIIDLLSDPDRFLRYLLLLLAADDADPFDLAAGEDEASGSSNFEWSTPHGDIPLLETMLKALSDDPTRLEHVQRLLDDLDAVDDDRQFLPQGFREVWDPIYSVSREL